MNYSVEHQDLASVAVERTRFPRNAMLVAIGTALAASALVVRQRTRQAERDNPPLGQFIEVDGVRLHYVERGQGQPVVLLHGNGSMIQDFDICGLLDLAAQHYRVIAFDRPGYGYSERPRNKIWNPQAQAALLHQALQQLDVEQPVVLGHSWGTLVALSLALDFPQYVKSLVLLSGYYYPTLRMDVPLMSPPAIPLIGDLLRYTLSPLIGRMLWPALRRRIFSPADVSQRFLSEFPVWMMLRPLQIRASAAETALLIPSAFSLRKRYHELSVPVVMVAGSEDRHLSTRVHSEHLHQELPQSDLYLVSGAGHMVHHLAPQQVMAAIDQAAHAGVPSIAEKQVPVTTPQFDYYGS